MLPHAQYQTVLFSSFDPTFHQVDLSLFCKLHSVYFLFKPHSMLALGIIFCNRFSHV